MFIVTTNEPFHLDHMLTSRSVRGISIDQGESVYKTAKTGIDLKTVASWLQFSVRLAELSC